MGPLDSARGATTSLAMDTAQQHPLDTTMPLHRQWHAICPPGSTSMLRPLIKGTPSHRTRPIWLVIAALIAHAVPRGRWMWADLAGATPEGLVEAYLLDNSLAHALSMARIEGTRSRGWAIVDDDGHGVLGRYMDGGTLILPALLRFDRHKGQHGRVLPEHPTVLSVRHEDTAGVPTRARLPHPITVHPPQDGSPTSAKARAAAARLCEDVDRLATVFEQAQGDGRFPHLQDGAYGPSLWPAAAPRPACPTALERGQRTLDTAAAWVWGARTTWGYPEEPFSLERPGHNGNRLLIRTQGPRLWKPSTRTHLVVEHLERAFPPTLAQALAQMLRTPLGRAVCPNTQKGGLGPRDATPLLCAMDSSPTHHALMAALAHGLPTPAHQRFWDATFSLPEG